MAFKLPYENFTDVTTYQLEISISEYQLKRKALWKVIMNDDDDITFETRVNADDDRDILELKIKKIARRGGAGRGGGE